MFGRWNLDIGRRLTISYMGVFVRTKRRTWSFTWKVRWHWKPDWMLELPNGWSVFWGWWSVGMTAWDEGDDWGDDAAEHHREVLRVIVNELGGVGYEETTDA